MAQLVRQRLDAGPRTGFLFRMQRVGQRPQVLAGVVKIQHAHGFPKTVLHNLPNPHPAAGHHIHARDFPQSAPPGLGLPAPAKLQQPASALGLRGLGQAVDDRALALLPRDAFARGRTIQPSIMMTSAPGGGARTGTGAAGAAARAGACWSARSPCWCRTESSTATPQRAASTSRSTSARVGRRFMFFSSRFISTVHLRFLPGRNRFTLQL